MDHRTDPSTARVVGRGTVLGAAFGAASGATLWIGGCVVSGTPAGIPLGFLAGVVGAVIGAPVGVVSTLPLLAARRRQLHRHAPVSTTTAAVAGALVPGLVTVLITVAVVSGRSQEPTTAVIWCAIVAMAITSGAVAGPLTLRPEVSARRNGAAAAVGRASPGSSPAPGR